MSKAFDELCNIIESAGLKLTFDRGRNNTLPCTFCGSLEGPRELVALGTYYQGDVLSRPVCVACLPIANLRTKRPEPAGVIPDDGKTGTT